MKIGRLIKTAVKFAPIVIPVVKKVMKSRSGSKKTVSSRK